MNRSIVAEKLIAWAGTHMQFGFLGLPSARPQETNAFQPLVWSRSHYDPFSCNKVLACCSLARVQAGRSLPSRRHWNSSRFQSPALFFRMWQRSMIKFGVQVSCATSMKIKHQQGSRLSLLLFNIFVRDVPRRPSTHSLVLGWYRPNGFGQTFTNTLGKVAQSFSGTPPSGNTTEPQQDRRHSVW